MKNSVRDDIFFEDDQALPEDIRLLDSHPRSDESPNEQKFWREMKKKVLGEFAPSADLLMSEHDNDEEIYLVRYYFHEFRIGRGRTNERKKGAIYIDSFADAINVDLFPLLDRHVSLIEWLREVDFRGIDYDGNYAIH